MNAKDFEKYAGKKTTGEKSGDVLSGGKIIGYDPSDTHPLQLFAIDDDHGEDETSFPAIIPCQIDMDDYRRRKNKYIWVTVDNVVIDEPLDLTKILKGCEGVELWSDVLGECKLENIFIGAPYPIVVSIEDKYESFTKNGLYNNRYETGKCLLYPSESNRDWSTFKKPVEVKDGDWVVCCDKNETGVVLQYGCITMDWKYIIPFDKFVPGMAEEEMKKLSII